MPEPDSDTDLIAARALFAPFLAAHTECKSAIEHIKRAGEFKAAVSRPWGEDGIAIFLPADATALAAALNNLYLPPQFTGLYHKDSRQLEIIWTAYPISGSSAEVLGREFKFAFDANDHECNFGASSERLLTIAEHARPIGVSDTQHRNLESYSAYLRYKKAALDQGRDPPPGSPISFWVNNVDWEEERVIRLARHLNFYLTYYDAVSPYMFVWPQKLEAAKSRTRYVRAKFPEEVNGRPIDDDLLHFWMALKEGDASRKFVYAYRIVEHASFAFIDRAARAKIKRLMATSHEFSDKQELCDRVVATVLGAKDMDDGARIAAVLSDTIDPSFLWSEIVINRSAFENTITFDGGFVLEKIISREDTENTFAAGGIAKFAQSAKRIRNHLSHGRDKYTQMSITPTTRNFRQLERFKFWRKHSQRLRCSWHIHRN